MSIVELYGKCRALGYCDCGGSFGCVDREPIKSKHEPEVRLGPEGKLLDESASDESEVIDEPKSLPACGFCSRKGSPCAKHGGGPSNYKPLPDPKPRPPIQRQNEVIIERKSHTIGIKVGSISITIREES